jgi:hypothetical protein
MKYKQNTPLTQHIARPKTACAVTQTSAELFQFFLLRGPALSAIFHPVLLKRV